MANERKVSLTKIKSRQSSSSSESSSDERASKITKSSPPHRERNSLKKNSTDRDVTVLLRNSEMVAKYRNKNPHIAIEQSQTISNFTPDELSDSDEVWIVEIPNNINASNLIGQSFKLGSKSSTISTDCNEIECVTEKYNVPKAVSLVFQQKNSKLLVKNTTPIGRVVLRTKLCDSIEVPINLDDSKTITKVAFPTNLKVRHPLHGANFEQNINLDETIRNKLSKAHAASMHKSPRKVKQEKTVEIKIDADEPKTSKKLKKRKLEIEKEDDVAHEGYKKPKREIKLEDKHDNDLDWITKI